MAGVMLGSAGVGVDDVLAVARAHGIVTLGADAIAAIERSRRIIDQMIDRDEPIYGATTGFGSLARTFIGEDQRVTLQRALVRSHAAGMGDPVEPEVVRAMMFLRARSLARGFSGVRLEVVEALLAALNAGIVPIVPEYGSLGASGDLAPLAHVALSLIGEGSCLAPEGEIPSAQALADHGIEPLTLEAKEGLALINGTDGILGMLVLAIDDIERLLRTAEVAAAMTIEALLGTDRPFDSALQELRPHPGQVVSADNLRRMLAGSPMVASHRYDDPRVQDAYSLRCSPQVLGAVRDTLSHARRVAEVELGSAIDNPMVLPDGRIESGGNFHGAPLGYACDFLAIALADLGAMAERRINRLLDVTRSEGLPAFLSPDPGVNSGLMIAHYTAAAMTAANRRLATPASVDSIPTSAGQEDHVSMAWGAARKLRTIVRNATRIVSVELLAASAGLEMRAPLEPAGGTAAVLAVIRQEVPGPGADRFVAPELVRVEQLVGSGAILAAAESAVGALG